MKGEIKDRRLENRMLKRKLRSSVECMKRLIQGMRNSLAQILMILSITTQHRNLNLEQSVDEAASMLTSTASVSTAQELVVR